LYEEGAAIITANYTRQWPAAKSLNYIEGVMRVAEARRQEAIEVVYHDGVRVFEGATSNIFAVIDGRLCTPTTRILAGITRKVILNDLDLADRVEAVDFSPEALRQAAEVFLTASNKEVMPVVRIDDQVVGNGQVGAVTRNVMAQFGDYIRSGGW
jgi:branched-subunit amino acid aminotransferase/4-amino-4-deoxychorismate lyase